MPTSFITAEYIESGAFQGGEEDASKADIKYGEEVVVMKESEHKKLMTLLRELTRTSRMIRRGDPTEGDHFDFICASDDAVRFLHAMDGIITEAELD